MVDWGRLDRMAHGGQPLVQMDYMILRMQVVALGKSPGVVYSELFNQCLESGVNWAKGLHDKFADDPGVQLELDDFWRAAGCEKSPSSAAMEYLLRLP